MAAPLVAKAKALKTPSLKGAWSVGTITFIFYLFIIHSFKVNAAQATLVTGIVSVLLLARPLRISPSMKWYALFLVWSLITLPLSNKLAISWEAWLNVFKIWLICFMLYNIVRTPGQYRLIALAWLAMFAFYPVRGTLVNFLIGSSSFGRYAWNFTFSNFNDLAALTILPMALTTDRLRSSENKFIKLCALAGMLVLPFIVLITQSRGGLLGMGMFFAYMLARSKQKLRISLALVAIGFGAVMFAPQSAWERFAGMKNLTDTSNIQDADGSAAQRFTILKIALNVSKDNALVGVGIGAYPYSHALYALKRSEWASARGARDTHNTYVHVFAETGLIGFSLFFMTFFSAYKELASTARRLKKSTDPADKEMRDRCQAFQAGFVGFAVCAIFGSLDTMVFPFLFITLAAAAVRIPRASTAPVGPTRAAPVPASMPRFRGGWRPPQTRAIAP